MKKQPIRFEFVDNKKEIKYEYIFKAILYILFGYLLGLFLSGVQL